ncbi:MAG: hypothetical protein B1H08_06465 [Candidatus Omnitrophica bacterium 4484_171]|nr:MAG: hypothetical protein B1H08_06465 [Candidatus Omnitrophica bacterium 4484_171]
MALITPFDPWKNELCTCPSKYSLSAYTGCGHGCLYCYASSYIRNFFIPRAKKDFINRLKKEIKKLPPKSFLAMANSSDPYTPEDSKLKLTRKALEILKNYQIRLMLVTKSSLILRDIDILKDIKHLVVSISITTLDKGLSKKLEPNAPLGLMRLKTMEKLAKITNVVCRFDPLIYPLNTKNIKKTIKALKNAGAKQVITSTYKAKPDNLKRMMNIFRRQDSVWRKLYIKKGSKKKNNIYLPLNLRKYLINEVRIAALSEKLEFSSCREGFVSLNTVNCDGSSFF